MWWKMPHVSRRSTVACKWRFGSKPISWFSPSAMKVPAFPKPSGRRFSTCSTPPHGVIAAGRAPGLAWRSVRAWSAPTADASRSRMALMAGVRASVSPCRCRPSLRSKWSRRCDRPVGYADVLRSKILCHDRTPMSQAATILVIDDEPQIRKFLRISLASQGYKVLEAGTGAEGLSQAALNKPDLLVLDLGLPDMDGQDVLSQFREWSAVPVLVLSVRASEGEKVQALDSGANDYVTKPFGIQEFLARIRALLRQAPDSGQAASALVIGPLTVDLAYRRVLLDGLEVALTRKEYAVLAQLARYPGRVITQQQLLKDIWGPTHVEDTHYLRIVVGHLRQKLADDPAAPRFIVTEAGVGYRVLNGGGL